SRARADLGRSAPWVQRVRFDAAPVARVPDDAEVAELQGSVVAHEDVHRRQIAVEHLAAMEPSEDFEDPGDLAADGFFRPTLSGLLQKGAQVAMPRPLEREAIEEGPVVPGQRERVEHADGAPVPFEDLAEVRLAQPAVDVLA